MNEKLINRAKRLGVHIPEIMLPAKTVDMSKWAVVACDQYTSQPEYWDTVKELAGDEPSTLNLIFPEVFLESEGKEARIESINNTMRKYIDENILLPLEPCFIYVDRRTTHAPSRKGVMMALDLEKYDYNKGSQTMIRATEGTVLDRLPPRIRIRENAPIELPHIMVLIDDPERTVIEPIAAAHEKLEKVYDFDLMMGGQHISGYKINDEKMIDVMLSALEKLADKESFKSKYNVGDDKGLLLFAVGDGNHSLATAKAFWELTRKNLTAAEQENHPARYALIELVNVHDEGIVFEPIHRVVFNIEPEKLLKAFGQICTESGIGFDYKLSTHSDHGVTLEQAAELESKDECLQAVPFITKDGSGIIFITDPSCSLTVGTLQWLLDQYLKRDSSMKIDYIHGEDVVYQLGSKAGNMGFILPPMDKGDLFRSVILDGVLPKKTFSMGEAEEKRFYLECRKIR